MTAINYDEILNTITNSKIKNDTSNKNFLKTDIIGNTIIGRFLPYIKNAKLSDVPFFHHGWKSKLDNSGIFFVCLNTFGEKCNACSKSISMWKSDDPLIKKASEPLRRRQNWLKNFYVISDQKNPENNGTIKILKFGKQIRDKIDLAVEGADKEIYGSRIYRLDEQGCNFRIITKLNSGSKDGWPTYADSGFLPPSAIPNMTEDRMWEIYNGAFDLTTLYKKTTNDEVNALLQKHYFINEVTTINSPKPDTTSTATPTTITVPPPPTVTTPPVEVTATQSDKTTKTGGLSESTIDSMLAELQGEMDNAKKA